MATLKMPVIFSDFRSIEKAFVFLIVIKLCFSGIALMEHFRAGPDSPLTLSTTSTVYAQPKADPATLNHNPPIAPSLNVKMLENIKKRKEELDAREASLNDKDKRLNMLQMAIDQKLQKMTSVQKKIEQLLTAREDLIDRSLKHLVKVYSSMKPNEAASLMEKLDKDISIQILSRMKGKNAAKILEKMDTGIAINLSDKIAKRK